MIARLAEDSIQGSYRENGNIAVALVLGSLYQALVAAGAPAELARRAAEEAAGGSGQHSRLHRDLTILKWMLAFVIWLGLGVFCMQWQTLCVIGRLEARLTSIEHSLTFAING